MSLFELQQPSRFSGIRLKRLEFQNWGTFDKQIFTLDYEGMSSLLVGPNGTGKTTLSDALLTLLVEKSKRNYNVSASAYGKKRGRNEYSYVRGDFKEMSADGGFSAKKVSLRKKDGTLSIILGVFENYSTGEMLTIAQVIYISGKETVPIYCYCEKERSIAEIVHVVTALNRLKKDLRRIGFVICQPIRSYYDKIREWTGIRPKALDVFNQTVAVKEIPDLNSFIRQYMLDTTDYRTHIDSILTHYDDLQNSYEKISHAAEQIAQLEPIASEGKGYRALLEKLDEERSKLATHRYFFASKALEVFQKALEDAKLEKEALEKKRQAIQRKIDDLDERRRILESEKEQKGGFLKGLQDQLASAKDELAAVQRQRREFLDALSPLKIEIKPDSESLLKEILSTVRELLSEAESKLDGIESRIFDCKKRLEKNESDISFCANELSDLKDRPSNIPNDLNDLRCSIADTVGLKPTALPFAAELIQVRESEYEWKPTIEKVLRPFGTTLLVPESKHAQVVRYAEANKLTNRKKKGMLLTFEKIYANDSFGMEGVAPDSRTVAGKLDYKIAHEFGQWVRREVSNRFSIRCFENVEEFRGYNDSACTLAGQIRNREGRIRKDDRDKSNDPLNYILGWDNEEKRESLIRELERSRSEKVRNGQNLTSLKESKAYWDNVSFKAPDALKIKTWEEIDEEPFAKEIKEKENEISSHLAKNQSVAQIEKKIVEVKNSKAAREREKEEHSEKIGSLNQKMDTYENSVLTSSHELEPLSKPNAEELEDMGGYLKHHYRLNVETIYKDRSKSKEFIDSSIKDLERERSKAIQSIERKMVRFLEAFKNDGFDERMEANIAYLAQFEELYTEIAEDRLWAFKEKFRKIAQSHVQNDLAQFNQVLRRASKDINQRIEEINLALHDIEFSKGTYIKLLNRHSKFEEGDKLLKALNNALSGTIGRQGTFEEAEAFFRSLEPLLANLSDPEWVSKACDVRLWHHFTASERFHADDTESRGHRSSDDASGGEKAKLAFTILVAAIVYQYNIDPNNSKAPTFRLALIDEAFAKVDDKFATYTLNLLKRFDIQLIVVAPLDPKARVVEPYVDYFVMTDKKSCEDEMDRSILHILEKEEFQERAANAKPSGESQVQSA